MDKVAAGLTKKSDQIRALDQAGYTRRQIADYLGTIPQHVRNVLVRRPRTVPEQVRVKIGPGGRIVIPAAYRQALEVKEGDEIVLRLEDGELRLISPALAIRRAQEIVRRHVPEGVRLSDELIAERRAEAERDASGD
jgi:AbrB family looped-hinge helix DNA binding protein